MRRKFRKTAKIALALIYLVIMAGAIVRVTGSGMGCPDWPKCFGYLVPPSNEAQLNFKPNTNYKKGIFIINNEKLWVADTNFISSNQFNSKNWKPYTKHNYAKYNPVHTWVEYINRLASVVSGLPILIFAIFSFFLWRKNKWITIVSILTILAMAFQAWLGKTVVDSNLAPYKITVHMVMALVIVAFILYTIFLSKRKHRKRKYNKTFNILILIALSLTLIQIVMGTQVRQFVDEQIKLIGYEKTEWLLNPSVSFYTHRSFSILVFSINLWLFLLNRNSILKHTKMEWVMYCIIFEIFSGIVMYYLDFPIWSQPLHLFIATVLFGLQFYIVLEVFHKKRVSNATKNSTTKSYKETPPIKPAF